MRSNILKVNVHLIHEMIDKYECIKGFPPSYIIMNKRTLDLSLISKFKPDGNSTFIAYHGIPVAICEKLEDGEVELVR